MAIHNMTISSIRPLCELVALRNALPAKTQQKLALNKEQPFREEADVLVITSPVWQWYASTIPRKEES